MPGQSTPLRASDFSPEQVEKFWSKVDRRGGPDACWLWLGSLSAHGYGVFYAGNGRYVRANRLAHALAHGAIGADEVAAHRCDTPPCCNPAHIGACDQRTNVADRNRKGRQDHGPNAPRWSPRPRRGRVRGERAPRAKLTAEQVREIRARYAAGGVTQAALCSEYGVTRNAMQLLLYRKSWRHVE